MTLCIISLLTFLFSNKNCMYNGITSVLQLVSFIVPLFVYVDSVLPPFSIFMCLPIDLGFPLLLSPYVSIKISIWPSVILHPLYNTQNSYSLEFVTWLKSLFTTGFKRTLTITTNKHHKQFKNKNWKRIEVRKFCTVWIVEVIIHNYNDFILIILDFKQEKLSNVFP